MTGKHQEAHRRHPVPAPAHAITSGETPSSPPVSAPLAGPFFCGGENPPTTAHLATPRRKHATSV
ncbi:hypothetical protein Thpro_021762 [Acidihalobacter prosperus]|uniref:Uncharacterized protein n=1 Tax=Acidihalobacter prosperus TaxID=160660 RepID=A0A1A6C4F5_9GAMM|nr:hypothetical protein Thpro_021762 [Acidihalobacter prosperus]